MCACYRPNKTKLNYGSAAQVELPNRSTETPRFGKTMPAELSCEVDQSVTDHVHHQIKPPQIATANCWDRTEWSASMLHVD
jgi:hypothetical protein